jgi:predicted acyl esterase
VHSFDGVPLDVDVTLPATGKGPFPTIVMLHGWGGSKTSFEASTPAGDGNETYDYNNLYYAQHGFAVVNYSSRGWGDSCGTAESRLEGGCAEGWIRLADQRYEARDTQFLLGELVDQHIARGSALGVTGISYGGGQSIELAYLKNRIRLPNGEFERWR